VSALAQLVETRHVVICCGTGGVGKTTTAAALAIEGARRGRDSVVVTIDPAKRLANTLGLEHLSNSPREIPRDMWDNDHRAPASGRLHALMLDTKTTFDQLVQKYALTDDQSDRILENRFYRNVAGALSGTQEYMAMEKLYELHDSDGFDLIVVDTPPTRHALDFLDAPRRMTRLLDNRIFRMLMVPTRATLRVGSVAAQTLLRTIARVVGSEAIDDAMAFFRAFEGMEAGFRERAAAVTDLLGSSDTSFVLVTSPRRDAVEEAQYFAEQLYEGQFTVDALVVNRVHAHYGTLSPDALRARATGLRFDGATMTTPEAGAAVDRLVARYTNLAELEDIAGREREELSGLESRIGNAPIAYVPELGRDVHDFDALHAVGEHLMAQS
jgi:anion-transporting  ArsA/GET3 family ATPase